MVFYEVVYRSSTAYVTGQRLAILFPELFSRFLFLRGKRVAKCDRDVTQNYGFRNRDW